MKYSQTSKNSGFANTLLMILAFMGGVIVASHWYLRSRDTNIPDVDGDGLSTVAVENVPVEESSESTMGVTSKFLEKFEGDVAGAGTERELAIIADLFSKETGKVIEEIDVFISEMSDAHMLGSVSFTGDFSSSWFLAIKEESGWKLVGTGEDAIPCELADYHGFSLEMVPECWDASGEVYVKR